MRPVAVIVGTYNQGSGNSTEDPEGADKVFEHVLEDETMHKDDKEAAIALTTRGARRFPSQVTR